MKTLPLLGLVAAAAIALSSKPSKPVSTKSSKLYISKDCEWMCGGYYDPDIVLKLAKEELILLDLVKQGFEDPQSLAMASLSKTYNWKCKLPESISQNDTLTLRFIYSNALSSSACFLAKEGIVDPNYLASWFYEEYPKILVNLGLLIPGNFQEKIVTERLSVLTKDDVIKMVANFFTLMPEIKNLDPHILVTTIISTICKIVDIEQKDKCAKITTLTYADFSNLSGAYNPVISKAHTQIYEWILEAKKM